MKKESASIRCLMALVRPPRPCAAAHAIVQRACSVSAAMSGRVLGPARTHVGSVRLQHLLAVFYLGDVHGVRLAVPPVIAPYKPSYPAYPF